MRTTTTLSVSFRLLIILCVAFFGQLNGYAFVSCGILFGSNAMFFLLIICFVSLLIFLPFFSSFLSPLALKLVPCHISPHGVSSLSTMTTLNW